MTEKRTDWTVTVDVAGYIVVEITADKPITAVEAQALARKWVSDDNPDDVPAHVEESHRELTCTTSNE